MYCLFLRKSAQIRANNSFSYKSYMRIKYGFWHFQTFIVCVGVKFFYSILWRKKKSNRTMENFFIIKLWYFIFFYCLNFFWYITCTLCESNVYITYTKNCIILYMLR